MVYFKLQYVQIGSVTGFIDLFFLVKRKKCLGFNADYLIESDVVKSIIGEFSFVILWI